MTRFPEEDIFDTAALTRSSEVKYSIDTEALTRSPRQVSTVKPPLTDTFRKRTLAISGNVSTGSTSYICSVEHQVLIAISGTAALTRI